MKVDRYSVVAAVAVLTTLATAGANTYTLAARGDITYAVTIGALFPVLALFEGWWRNRRALPREHQVRVLISITMLTVGMAIVLGA